MKLLGAKLRGIFCEILRPSSVVADFGGEGRSPSTLLAYSAEAVASAAKAGRQGYGGFSSPSSSQQAARYSAKENKSEVRGFITAHGLPLEPRPFMCW
jgi:hypothetical protein